MKKIILTLALIVYSSTPITAMRQRMTKVYNNLFTQEEGRVAPDLPDDQLPQAILVSGDNPVYIPRAETIAVATITPVAEIINVVATPATPRNQPHSLVLVLNQNAEEVPRAAENMVATPRFARSLEPQESNRWIPIIDMLNTQEMIQPNDDHRQCCSIS